MAGSPRQRFAWCLFDFANSPFPTIALTAFGAPYFEGVLVGESGLSLFGLSLGPKATWGIAISLSMALVTVTAPILGAVVDRGGRRKPFLFAYVVTCVAATAGLAWVQPGQALLALSLYVVANFAFEGAYVFYNAYLPDLAPPERVGRLSGYGWALGYVGGLAALLLVKFGLDVLPAEYDAAHASGASSIYLVIAIWYAVFSLPALLWLRDSPRARATPRLVRDGFRSVVATFKAIRSYRVIAWFLLAYFLYTDALTTVIEFVGIYTKDVLAFSPADNITLFLLLNMVAAPGALLFGYLLDRVGGKRAIIVTLVLWLVVVVGTIATTSKAGFWPVAIVAAIVIGATQSSSRALMARLAPRERIGEFMGFLALSGKASAIVGPTLYGAVADGLTPVWGEASAHRVAVGLIGSFFAVAIGVMLRVDESASEAAVDAAGAAPGGEGGSRETG